jgi:hypothetical protein
MKTVREELLELRKQKVVDLKTYTLLKRLERLRRYLNVSDQTFIRSDEGIWSLKR